jgi:parallel beta-helix repeat protein
MARHPKYRFTLCGAAGLLTLVGAGLFAAVPASADVSTTASPRLYVATTGSDTSNTCRLATHPCLTVDYALTQAPPGAIIALAAGTYTAPIAVSNAQTVTISGKARTGTSATIIDPATTVADTDGVDGGTPQPIGALVDVTGGATVDLKNLTIEGSSASPTFDPTGCANNFVGVYYHDASGTVSNVTIDGVQLSTTLFGCQDGLAAYVATDQPVTTASAVTFSNVSTTNYDKNGFTCNFLGTTCNVTNSVARGIGPTAAIAQNGIQLAYGAAGSITGSRATANSYTLGTANNQATGILVYDTGATTVTGNTLSANDVNLFAGADSGSVSGNWNISGNTVNGATNNAGNGRGNGYGDGIQIQGVTATNPTTVANNVVQGSYEYGIGLYGAVGATVSTNTTNRNYDGIYVDSASSQNNLTSNTSRNNLRYDYEDTSTGTGTVGTANTWTTDTCYPHLDSAPEGLC